ncbi:MAG TPA: PKD domain-containing protein, partial [Vicinamibacteria bacterium]|nr:PKD domain-containing protein [Vicinamibacteria bacterium]
MSPACAGVVGTLVLALPAAGLAQGLAIDPQPVGCIVAGKYSKLQACFTPTDVVRPRANFRLKEGAAAAASYYVEMKSDMPCHVAFLPRPKKELIGKEIEIWIEGMDRAFNAGRTPEYSATVVGSESECRKDLPVAPWVSSASVAVFPAMPAGFVASALPALGVVAGVAGGTALVAGAYVATKGDDDPPTVPVTPTPPPTPAPTPTPVPTPTPPPATTPTVDCTIRPRSGPAPLTVSFSAAVSGFSGPVAFRWDFGDGTGSTDRDTTHTYTAPGVFRAIVTATSGSETATCDRNVSVSKPEEVLHTLEVTLTGSGGGTVSSNPSGVSCLPDCSEAYPSGTVVSLTAAPDSSSSFVGWSGACSGSGACNVSMNVDRDVTAKFDAK